MYRHPDSSGSLEEWFGKNAPPEVPGAASAGREVTVCSRLRTTSMLQAPRRDRRSPDAGVLAGGWLCSMSLPCSLRALIDRPALCGDARDEACFLCL